MCWDALKNECHNKTGTSQLTQEGTMKVEEETAVVVTRMCRYMFSNSYAM